MQQHEHGEKKRCGKRNQGKGSYTHTTNTSKVRVCRESGGGGSCNPGEIQLLPVPPLRRHVRPSPGANAAASPTAAAAATGLGPDWRPGEREVATAIESSACSHAHSCYTRTEFLGCGVGTHKREKDLFLASSWLDLAGAPRRWYQVCAPAARLVCAWGLGADGDVRRAMISSLLPLP